MYRCDEMVVKGYVRELMRGVIVLSLRPRKVFDARPPSEGESNQVSFFDFDHFVAEKMGRSYVSSTLCQIETQLSFITSRCIWPCL